MSYEQILKETGLLIPSDSMMELINYLGNMIRDLQTEIVLNDLKSQYLFAVSERLENGEKWVKYSSGHFVRSEG
jgi:hypothetical protein